MMVIGLTGGICCGKSTAGAFFAQAGAGIVDADAISHSLTQPGGAALPLIRDAFGEGVFTPSGELDRRELAALVFSDPAALQTLNRITHPLIRREMENQLAGYRRAGKSLVILDVPLLYEANMEDLADKVLCVTVPREVQVERLRERDGLNRSQAESRIASQMPVEEKAARADYVLSTHRPLEETRRELSAILEKLKEEEAHE